MFHCLQLLPEKTGFFQDFQETGPKIRKLRFFARGNGEGGGRCRSDFPRVLSCNRPESAGWPVRTVRLSGRTAQCLLGAEIVLERILTEIMGDCLLL